MNITTDLYNELKNRITENCSECRKAIKALDDVWAKVSHSPTEKSDLFHPVPVSTNGNGLHNPPELTTCVRGIIGVIGKQFDGNQIFSTIIKNKSMGDKEVLRSQITNTLFRLEQRGEIKKVKEGRGRIAAVYENVNVAT